MNLNNIEILPEHIIDQIKAGEVLERPAALLKELIENSIDAQSTEINIHLIENGLSLLSIEDNGVGIDFHNLPKAFLRHATSKLKKFEDLYNLYSYGFRGEALASLAASARVTCISQPENLNIAGGKLIIHGGKEELLTSQLLNQHGTSLFIKDLFYNTPARLKFIKSKTSEKIQLKKIIYSFILSHPEIQFSIKWDDKEKEFFKKYAFGDFSKRVENIFPNHSVIYKAEETYQNYSVSIHFTQEASRNSAHKHQYLFVNSRYFQDKSLHQTVLRSIDALWSHGESGHYVILIKTPTDAIDVNVHPNKTQIKFLDSDIIYSLLVTAIKTALRPKHIENPTPLSYPTPLIPHNVSQFASLELSTPDYFQGKTPLHIENTLSIIDQSFALMLKNSQYTILNLKLLIDDVFLLLIDRCLESEECVSPLLVSEPFQVKNTQIDKSFEQLKKLGFEFDRLSSEVIILRTIPKNLPRALLKYSSSTLIEYFISNYENYRRSSFELYLNKSKDSQVDFTVSLIENLISLTSIENKPFAVKLNKSNLGLLFK